MTYQKAKEILEQKVLDIEALEVIELEAIRERADIGGTAKDEEDNTHSEENVEFEEKTGVTHLVHSWYPLGHSVSE